MQRCFDESCSGSMVIFLSDMNCFYWSGIDLALLHQCGPSCIPLNSVHLFVSETLHRFVFCGVFLQTTLPFERVNKVNKSVLDTDMHRGQWVLFGSFSLSWSFSILWFSTCNNSLACMVRLYIRASVIGFENHHISCFYIQLHAV